MALRDESGQASIEQVGLVALIALVLLAAGGVTAVAAPGFANRVTTAMQRALCTVSGQACPTLDREPCPLLRTDRTFTTRASFSFLRLGDDRSLLIERRSDGSYVIHQIEGVGGGLGLMYGGPRGEASVDALLSARAGRTYTAPDRRTAAALVHRLRRELLPGADAVIDGAADLVGLAHADPSVDSYTVSGKGAISAAAKLGFGKIVEGGVDADGGLELGLRVAAHRKEATAFVSLDGRVGAFFSALPEVGLTSTRRPRGRGQRGDARGEGEGTSATGSLKDPLNLSRSAEVMASGTVALHLAPGPRVLEIEVTGRVGSKTSMREVHARLDPNDPDVAAAFAAWRRHPMDAAALSSLGRAAAAGAAIDERRFSVASNDKEYGGEVGEGASIGGTLKIERRTARLVGQRSRPAGGVWEERLDCAAA